MLLVGLKDWSDVRWLLVTSEKFSEQSHSVQ